MAEEAAEAESRGHQETPRADSGQGLADGIIWPSVTGSQACSPKWTDVSGAETECRLLSNLILLQQTVLPVLKRDLAEEEEGDAGNHQPSSLPPHSH